MKKGVMGVIVMLGLTGIIGLQAQTLSPSVISSTGGYYTSADASLSFTVAEMTMVQTFTSIGNILTQGFQQPEEYAVSVPENPQTSGYVNIYPNPTSGKFVLTYNGPDQMENTVKLYNLIGQLKLTSEVSQQGSQSTVNFDLSTFDQGIYMLELTLVNSDGQKSTEIHKVNVVY